MTSCFRDILLRLRNGESTQADWEVLSTRFENKLSKVERDKFSEVTHIIPTWSDVNEVNFKMLGSLHCPVAKIHAVNTGGKEACTADSDIARGLEAHLLIAKGARVMLTSNLLTSAGLVNGAIGTVIDILFEEQGPPSLPTAVLIAFDNYNGPSIITPTGINVVLIPPIRRN